jgi:hypothetical protein
MSIPLRAPTDRTVEGPSLKMEKGRLVVAYDFERDDGSIEHSRVVFEEVISYDYRDTTCCSAENVASATEVRVQTESKYLDSIMSRWEERVGWHAWQKEQGGAPRFKHFSLYFDDVASLDVIASSCHLSP